MIFCWLNEIICRIVLGFLQVMLVLGIIDWVYFGVGLVDGLFFVFQVEDVKVIEDKGDVIVCFLVGFQCCVGGFQCS